MGFSVSIVQDIDRNGYDKITLFCLMWSKPEALESGHLRGRVEPPQDEQKAALKTGKGNRGLANIEAASGSVLFQSFQFSGLVELCDLVCLFKLLFYYFQSEAA